MSLQDMPPIRAGPDALHFEVNVEIDPRISYLSKEEIGTVRGASLKDGGILRPIGMSTPSLGVHSFDLGQNMVGWCRFKLLGPPGLGIYFRHAEILSQPLVSNGSVAASLFLPSLISDFSQSYGGLYTENLRSATQSDTYILRGDPEGEIYEPR